jgi:hypothetical protein
MTSILSKIVSSGSRIQRLFPQRICRVPDDPDVTYSDKNGENISCPFLKEAIISGGMVTYGHVENICSDSASQEPGKPCFYKRIRRY